MEFAQSPRSCLRGREIQGLAIALLLLLAPLTAGAAGPAVSLLESLSTVSNLTAALMRNGQVGRLEGVPSGVADRTRALVDQAKLANQGCVMQLPGPSKPTPLGPDKERTDIEMSVTGPGCPFSVKVKGFFLRDGTQLQVDIKWDYLSQKPDVVADTGLESMSMQLAGGGHILQPEQAVVDYKLELTGDIKGVSVKVGSFSLKTDTVAAQFIDFTGRRPSKAREYEKISVQMGAQLEELYKEVLSEGSVSTKIYRHNGQDISSTEYESIAAGFRLPSSDESTDDPLPVPMSCQVNFYKSSDLSAQDAQALLDRNQAIAKTPVHRESVCLDVGTRESRVEMTEKVTTDIFASNQEIILTTTRNGQRDEFFTAPGLPAHLAASVADRTVTYQCKIVSACPKSP